MLEAEARYEIGSIVDPWDFLQPSSQNFDAEHLSAATELSLYGRGEPPYELINEVLVGAGVRKDWLDLSEAVMSWLGRSGKSALEARFGENWKAVAGLEYCVKHFPPSSLATLAARTEVADYLADYEYDCGYAAKELEMLYGGAEEVAIQSMQARQSAGAGGGAASRKRKLGNLEVLMTEVEKLAPAVGLISEDRILGQAFDAARQREPKMPKSKKTLDDYGIALRSEEPFKSRYEAVFRKNA